MTRPTALVVVGDVVVQVAVPRKIPDRVAEYAALVTDWRQGEIAYLYASTDGKAQEFALQAPLLGYNAVRGVLHAPGRPCRVAADAELRAFDPTRDPEGSVIPVRLHLTPTPSVPLSWRAQEFMPPGAAVVRLAVLIAILGDPEHEQHAEAVEATVTRPALLAVQRGAQPTEA